MRRPRSGTRDDFDRVKDSIHELKAENKKLRKENSQLRKELNRLLEADFSHQIDLEEEEVQVYEPPTKEHKRCCPKCKSTEFKIILAGKFEVSVCEDCGFKKRKEAKA